MDGTGHALQRCDRPAPGGATLATNPDSPVKAAEIRYEKGIFRGVQYHPELSLAEIAASTAHQSEDVTEQGLARDRGEVDALTGRCGTSTPCRAAWTWHGSQARTQR